ncbi:MAG: sulfotransferase, partial [Verrucomicrobia bacterium]|nr:sulfotransferase [Verrucomicrobiota bacterium]
MGEKAPAYHTCLPEIARLFPEAGFVIIWRDPIECCRSVAQMAHRDRHFAQPGFMTRTLFGAEILASGVEHLRRDGRRVHEVVYARLLERPESELRRLCEFLGLPFDPAMLDLKSADRRISPGLQQKMIRSTVQGELLSPSFLAKAGRYAALWRERYAHLKLAEALQGASDHAKPGTVEQGIDQVLYFFWQRMDALKRYAFRHTPLWWWAWARQMRDRLQAGAADPNPAERDSSEAAAVAGRNAACGAVNKRPEAESKRAFFGFILVSWIQTYRQGKAWFLSGRDASLPDRPFGLREFLVQFPMIFISGLILAGVAAIDLFTPPDLALTPFYLIPCGMAAFLTNRRWGTVFAIITTLVWSAARMAEQPYLNSHYGLLLWNCVMRFILLEFVVLLFNRIRLEIASLDKDGFRSNTPS